MALFKKAEDIKVGVIGYGGAFNMGKAHLSQMQAAGMTPVAVAEIDKSRLKVAEEDFPGIETYDSVAKMLKKSDVNLVTIITPHDTHAKLAVQCLEAGKHVCCEKPFAITTKECETMMREAKKQNLVLTTYHNRHWDGGILKAMQIKKDGFLGDVFRVEAHMGGYGCPGPWWRSSKSVSGGVLYDWGVHLLEYSLQLMDDDMEEVFGYAHTGFWSKECSWKNDTNEDEAMAVVRFKKGGLLTLKVTTIDSDPEPFSMKAVGTLGSIQFGPGGPYRLVTHYKGEKFVSEGDSPAGEGWRYYQNVADHMVKGTKLVITPEWATRPIHILDLAGQSVKKGKAIKAKHK